MRVNPVNIINLLLTTFQAMNIPETPVNHAELELKENIEKILLNAMDNFNEIETLEDNTLEFEEEFKNCEATAIEDNIWYKSPTDSDKCTMDDEKLSYEYKKKAVEYWRSGKTGNLRIDTVRQKYKKVSSERQLRRWVNQINKGGTYMEKLTAISEFVLKNFKDSIKVGNIIHDTDLRKWALQAKNNMGFHDIRFKASDFWVYKFKKEHRIVDRKINKFITKKNLRDESKLKDEADKFVDTTRNYIHQYGEDNVYNSDQSGFELEIHSKRTLTEEGTKKVECVVQSISATTHSYTIQPTINAAGKLLSPLFLVMKETKDEFGPIIQKNLFKPPNVYVMASKSGKLTKGTCSLKIYF